MISRPLIILPDAERDISEACAWYDEQQQDLGTEFLTSLNSKFLQLSEIPELNPPEYKTIRRSAVTRFPYVIYYRIVRNTIEVIAVLHGSRSPRAWRSRA